MGIIGKKPELQPGQVPCPHCRRALEWNQPNNQWFCRRCDLFVAPEANSSDIFSDFVNEIDDIFDDKPKYYCDICGARLDWSAQYNRWHCGRCQTWK
ncbi:MAG: hypothetical protein KAR56_04340 [Thermoplasmata archaeon]|nr:hypothetical protein [Thermoplasmata archaeon]